MTEPTPQGDAAEDSGRERATGLAGWQKVVAVIGLIVVVVLVILLLAGDHGPGRHAADVAREEPSVIAVGGEHGSPGWRA